MPKVCTAEEVVALVRPVDRIGLGTAIPDACWPRWERAMTGRTCKSEVRCA
jgi:hypothetical protein